MSLDVDRLESPLRKLRKISKKFPKEPSPELVHDLRTRIRRVEANSAALKLTDRARTRRLLKELDPVRGRAGKVRDRDVLTGFASSLDPHHEEDCLVQLLEHLGAERDRHARKLYRLIRKRNGAIRSDLKRTLTFVDKELQGAGKLPANQWAARAMSHAIELSSELSRWPRLNAGNLHPFRLKVKELRYVLQLASNSDTALVDNLGEVKDVIGEWHDWTELRGIAKEVLDHGSNCKLLQAINAIATQKFGHALSVANEMRYQYLREPGRTRKGGSSPRAAAPVKGPVLAAASNLAA